MIAFDIGAPFIVFHGMKFGQFVGFFVKRSPFWITFRSYVVSEASIPLLGEECQVHQLIHCHLFIQGQLHKSQSTRVTIERDHVCDYDREWDKCRVLFFLFCDWFDLLEPYYERVVVC